MAKLITILKKQSWEEWKGIEWFTNPLSVFTQEEYDAIVAPFIAYAKTLPGLQPEDIQYTLYDNEYVTMRTFDTIQNAKNAMAALSVSSTEPVVRAMYALLRIKQAQYGYAYDREMRVAP